MTEYFLRKPQNVSCRILQSEDDLVGSGFRFDKTRLQSFPGAEWLVIRRQAGELIAELMTHDRKGPVRTVRGLRLGGLETGPNLWLEASEWDGTKVFIYRLGEETKRGFRIEFFWSNGDHAGKLPTIPGNIEFDADETLEGDTAARSDEKNEDDVGDGYHED